MSLFRRQPQPAIRPDGVPVWYGISLIHDTNSVRRYESWVTTERPAGDPHFVVRVASRYGANGRCYAATDAVTDIARFELNQRRANPALADAYRRLRERIMAEWQVPNGTSSEVFEQMRRGGAVRKRRAGGHE